jgi:hypothetical protein
MKYLENNAAFGKEIGELNLKFEIIKSKLRK